MIQVYEAGRCIIAGGAPEAASEPGDLVVTDLACPITTRETAFCNINLCVPRSSIAPLLRAPDAHGGRVLRRDGLWSPAVIAEVAGRARAWLETEDVAAPA